MRKGLTTGLIVVFAVGVATAVDRGYARESSESDRTVVAQEVPESLMRQKLDHAQRLLEALSIGDFERIIAHSEELQRISLEARWSQPHSPAYAEYGEDFRSALERVVRGAENQNIDGAALNYVQMVLTCVQCHKVVREGEQFAYEAGGTAWGLLDKGVAAGAE